MLVSLKLSQRLGTDSMFKIIRDKIESKISTKIFFSTIAIVFIILLLQSFLYLFVIDDAHYLTRKIELSNHFEDFTNDIKDKKL